MFSAVFWINAATSVALIILGLLALLKNSRIFLNRIFFLFVISLAIWIMANFYSNDQALSLGQALIANHLTLFFPGFSLIFMLVFIGVLTKSRLYKKWNKPSIVFFSIAYLVSLTPLVVSSIARQEDVYAITFGPLASLYFAAILLNMGSIAVLLISGIRHTKGVEKARVSTIAWSILATIVISLATNVVLPIVSGSFTLTNFGPISAVIIVAGLFYSITKHQLFDIRLVVARSLGYLLSIVVLGVLYGTVAFLFIGGIVFRNNDITTRQQVVFASLAALITLFFQPIKRFFDRLTRKIFYKDGYDTQEFLNQLNRLLVSSLGLDNLLNNASQAIAQCLKLNVCFFAIDDVAHKNDIRFYGVQKIVFAPQDMELIQREISGHGENVVVTDLIENHQGLKALLTSKDIGMVARLEANQAHGTLGYLFLGIKKNGNPYTSQDTKLVSIIGQELVIAIQNNLRFEEIRKFNITLEEKIEEATRKLRQTNDKLRRLDETKDDFISMASHQLRTPLTSVKGYVSMVLDGDAGKISGLQRKLLTQSFISSQRMVYLISDLLNVSRLKTGKFIIEPTPTNLANVIEEEIDQLQETAKGRNLELTYRKPEHFPTLMIDETKIRQVLMNFIDNAVYYTPSGGHIAINLFDKGKTIEFTVVDDGIGVAKHEQHHLFSKFFRAHNAKRARPDGTGLGLFMAKKVIIAQGGAIIFKSQEGKGSTFGFMFAKDKLLPKNLKPTDIQKTPQKSDLAHN
ncbi:MAG TPA: ATP-binding protein [Patescibacteria group bacterium]|nr:ATP-binding protein [Patescibacteria group bacterium]